MQSLYTCTVFVAAIRFGEKKRGANITVAVVESALQIWAAFTQMKTAKWFAELVCGGGLMDIQN